MQETFLPLFNKDWVAQCKAVMKESADRPPNITRYPFSNLGKAIYADPSVLEEESLSEMGRYLKQRSCNMASRFAVLCYLRCVSLANVAPDLRHWSNDDEEEVPVETGMIAKANQALGEFLELLVPEKVVSPEQALWEFKQAFLLCRTERLMRLGRAYPQIAGTIQANQVQYQLRPPLTVPEP